MAGGQNFGQLAGNSLIALGVSLAGYRQFGQRQRRRGKLLLFNLPMQQGSQANNNGCDRRRVPGFGGQRRGIPRQNIGNDLNSGWCGLGWRFFRHSHLRYNLITQA